MPLTAISSNVVKNRIIRAIETETESGIIVARKPEKVISVIPKLDGRKNVRLVIAVEIDQTPIINRKLVTVKSQ